MNARKKIEKRNAGMKDRPEALSKVTSRGADFGAVRKFMEVRIWRTGMRYGRSIPTPVGSFANESIRWEAAGVREFFE